MLSFNVRAQSWTHTCTVSTQCVTGFSERPQGWKKDVICHNGACSHWLLSLSLSIRSTWNWSLIGWFEGWGSQSAAMRSVAAQLLERLPRINSQKSLCIDPTLFTGASGGDQQARIKCEKSIWWGVTVMTRPRKSYISIIYKALQCWIV